MYILLLFKCNTIIIFNSQNLITQKRRNTSNIKKTETLADYTVIYAKYDCSYQLAIWTFKIVWHVLWQTPVSKIKKNNENDYGYSVVIHMLVIERNYSKTDLTYICVTLPTPNCSNKYIRYQMQYYIGTSCNILFYLSISKPIYNMC